MALCLLSASAVTFTGLMRSGERHLLPHEQDMRQTRMRGTRDDRPWTLACDDSAVHSGHGEATMFSKQLGLLPAQCTAQIDVAGTGAYDCVQRSRDQQHQFLKATASRWKMQPKYVSHLRANATVGTCNLSSRCRAEMRAAASTPAPELNPFHDYAWCMRMTSCPAPTSVSCAMDMCGALAHPPKDVVEALPKLSIGIVAVDDRATNEKNAATAMWSAFASHHNYTFLPLAPSSSTSIESPSSSQQQRRTCTDPIMAKDWNSTSGVLRMLAAPEHAYLSHFVYIELDQWPVRPLFRLERLFDAADLIHPTSRKVMAVFGEYPCRDVRGGGLFNMGTYLLRRSQRARTIMEAWTQSREHGGPDAPFWPARQGAFAHDPAVYDAHADAISTFPSGCLVGSPFARVIAHALGGKINGIFDPDVLRHVVVNGETAKCVRDVLSGIRAGDACELCNVVDCKELRPKERSRAVPW